MVVNIKKDLWMKPYNSLYLQGHQINTSVSRKYESLCLPLFRLSRASSGLTRMGYYSDSYKNLYLYVF